jgi:cell division protein FtsW (lipid II flippase)
VIGILGILLPLVCWLGGKLYASLPLQQSISFYYHTNVQDFFVGILVVVSLFLISYKGYEVIDDIISTITGILGLGVVIFPCLLAKEVKTPIGFFQLNPDISDEIHMYCSVIFFLLLSANSFFLFTQTDKKKERTKNKKKRDIVYRVCGLLIFILTIALVILFEVNRQILEENSIVFYLETIMVVSFGVSWIVKGETIWRDPKSEK